MKYDALNLKLIGKDEKEIHDILTKRYQFTIQRLAARLRKAKTLS